MIAWKLREYFPKSWRAAAKDGSEAGRLGSGDFR